MVMLTGCLAGMLMCFACQDISEQPIMPGEEAAIAFWQQQAPSDNLVLSISGDINDDGLVDTLIIYRADDDFCYFIGVLDTTQGYLLTEIIPAPLENHNMFIRNMGGTPPYWVFISGQNGNNVGLGSFKLLGTEWVNPLGGGIFDGGYAGCCGI